ncbi:MAG: hypothetical protein HY549_00275 [Elusimicrobia bacterium]|nr:hypothetical protein [Elusimicrobiota bacterium]
MNALALALSLALSAYAQPPAPKVINMGPQFREFWNAAQARSFDEQLKLWDDLVEGPHQKYFDHAVWRKHKNADWRERKRRLLQSAFRRYPELAPKIDLAFRQFEHVLGLQVDRFRQIFPDARFDLDIYAGLSPTFLGMVTSLEPGGGSPVLVFAIDSIAADAERSPALLYAHELFHVYHHTVMGPSPSAAAMSLMLWHEGMAHLVAALVNPGSSDLELLGEPRLADMASKDLAWLAREFAPVAGQKVAQNHSLYQSWFDPWAPRLRPDLPALCGYKLGLEIARRAKQYYRLDEMSRWTPERAHEEVMQSLKVFAGG